MKYSWILIFFWSVKIVTANEPIKIEMVRGNDGYTAVNITSTLEERIIEENGQSDSNQSNECKFGVDYNSDGKANTFDWVVCKLGKFTAIFRKKPVVFLAPKIDETTQYALLMYPKNTAAKRDSVEKGGQFVEMPDGGNYVARDVYLKQNQTEKIVLIEKDNDQAEVNYQSLVPGQYWLELIYKYRGKYHTIKQEISLP